MSFQWQTAVEFFPELKDFILENDKNHSHFSEEAILGYAIGLLKVQRKGLDSNAVLQLLPAYCRFFLYFFCFFFSLSLSN
jgi:hypothetical protein